MPTNIVQGQNAVLSFYKNDFIDFVCSTNFTLEVQIDKIPIRTVGDGFNKKYKYQTLGYSLTLGGVLKFDEDGFTAFDLLTNQLNFTDILFQVSYSDDDGNIKSLRGYGLVENTSLIQTSTDLVKDDITITGNGSLMMFDGTIPCDSEIETITVTNTTSSDGTANINYTYSGAPAQVKYRIDNKGKYFYATAGTEIDIAGLSVGDHSIEIIPVCLNSYEGTGLTQTFTMTLSLTCALEITSVSTSVSGSTATVTVDYNSDPSGSTLQYRLNGGAWVTKTSPTDPFTFGISGLATGSYTLDVQPVCANGISGTGNSTTFTISTSTSRSTIDYTYAHFSGTGSLQIYVNGVLMANATADVTSSFTVAVGASVRGVLNRTTLGAMELITDDLSTPATIDDRTSGSGTLLQFTFTASLAHYKITGNLAVI